MCSLQAPSLLAFDKERAEGHGHPISGLARVPCATQMRTILAPVSPQGRRPVCQSVLRPLPRGKALAAMTVLDGHALLARDGMADFSSHTLHGASCGHRVHRHGSLTSAPQLWGAARLPPAQRAGMPRMPEPTGNGEGTAKHAGARQAVTRLVAKLRQEHPPLTCRVTADGLRAPAPHRETLPPYGLPDLLGVQAGEHRSRFQQVQAAEPTGRVREYARHDRAGGLGHRVRLVHALPRHASPPDLRVPGIAYGASGAPKVQPWSGVTDLRGRKRNGSQRMRGGRARGSIANATCKTLQHHGDHVEPHDGHGEQPLSVVVARRMRLAF